MLDFSKSRVLVVGDLMLDKYWYGDSFRVSPEAPVPIVNYEKETSILGGAANVAVNLSHLGVQTSLLGIVGDDTDAKYLKQEILNHKIQPHLITSSEASTIVKLRVIGRGQQLTRIDFEKEFATEDARNLVITFKTLVSKYDAVILSDYAKGSLLFSQELIKIANDAGVKVFVDPKRCQDFSIYKDAFLVKPNLNEFFLVAGSITEIDYKSDLEYQELITQKAIALCRTLNLENLLVTMAEKGMTLFSKSNSTITIKAKTSDVFDVTGAGDTVIASLTASYLASEDLKLATRLSSYAAAIVVNKFGTSFVSLDELSASITAVHQINYTNQLDKNQKLIQQDNLQDFTKQIRAKHQKIVFTNGCFDILHPGHIEYLQKAKALGDILILAINSDNSIKHIKGANRPINKLEDRVIMLSAFAFVDYIIEFDEDTPIKLIKEILPDILVKGDDYKASEIVGFKEVTVAGGVVETIEFKTGYSSSNIIDKIKNS